MEKSRKAIYLLMVHFKIFKDYYAVMLFISCFLVILGGRPLLVKFGGGGYGSSGGSGSSVDNSK